jgi:hypothetical protein
LAGINNSGSTSGYNQKGIIMSELDDKFKKIYEEDIRIIREISIESDEYIELPKSFVDRIEEQYVPLVGEVMNTDFWKSGDYHRQGFIGRYISDTDTYPDMNRIYNVLGRLDEKYRLWNQPYYTHQSNAGNINLSDYKCINSQHPEILQKLRSDTISNILESND